jgi:hypothetical protein
VGRWRHPVEHPKGLAGKLPWGWETATLSATLILVHLRARPGHHRLEPAYFINSIKKGVINGGQPLPDVSNVSLAKLSADGHADYVHNEFR